MERYDGPKFGNCKSCGKTIIWIRTQNGKNMPVDPIMVDYLEVVGGKERIVTPAGRVVAGRTDIKSGCGDGIGYISHFATCPNANQHRRKRNG